MKFSELLGEPERDHELPADDAAPISVFAPVPVEPTAPPAAIEYPDDPPAPVDAPVSAPLPDPATEPVPGLRTGLAEVNIRQAAAEVPTEENATAERLAGLDSVVDDLLPSTYQRRGRR